MEFLRSINLIRRNIPFPFYTLLFGLPLMVMTGLVIGAMVIPKEANTVNPAPWLNIYTVGIFGFLASINICFWKKLHWQRMGNVNKAKQWESAPNKLAIILFICAVLL